MPHRHDPKHNTLDKPIVPIATIVCPKSGGSLRQYSDMSITRKPHQDSHEIKLAPEEMEAICKGKHV